MLPKQDKPASEIHKTRELYWEKDMISHSRFINKATGRFEDEYVEQRNCPVCDSNDSQFLFLKAGGTHVKCASCGIQNGTGRKRSERECGGRTDGSGITSSGLRW